MAVSKPLLPGGADGGKRHAALRSPPRAPVPPCGQATRTPPLFLEAAAGGVGRLRPAMMMLSWERNSNPVFEPSQPKVGFLSANPFVKAEERFGLGCEVFVSQQGGQGCRRQVLTDEVVGSCLSLRDADSREERFPFVLVTFSYPFSCSFIGRGFAGFASWVWALQSWAALEPCIGRSACLVRPVLPSQLPCPRRGIQPLPVPFLPQSSSLVALAGVPVGENRRKSQECVHPCRRGRPPSGMAAGMFLAHGRHAGCRRGGSGGSCRWHSLWRRSSILTRLDPSPAVRLESWRVVIPGPIKIKLKKITKNCNRCSRVRSLQLQSSSSSSPSPQR